MTLRQTIYLVTELLYEKDKWFRKDQIAEKTRTTPMELNLAILSMLENGMLEVYRRDARHDYFKLSDSERVRHESKVF